MDGFPALRLVRVLRPTSSISTGDGSSLDPTGCWMVRVSMRWFPRSLSNRLTGEVSSYAPAASPRLRRRLSSWPPEPATSTDPGVLHAQRVNAHRSPAQIRQVSSWWDSLEGRSATGFSRTPSCLACRTRTIWQCWPAPSLSGLLSTLAHVPGFRLPPASSARCDGLMAVHVSSPHGWSAPRGARYR